MANPVEILGGVRLFPDWLQRVYERVESVGCSGKFQASVP